jgi:hypothetical protein
MVEEEEFSVENWLTAYRTHVEPSGTSVGRPPFYDEGTWTEVGPWVNLFFRSQRVVKSMRSELADINEILRVARDAQNAWRVSFLAGERDFQRKYGGGEPHIDTTPSNARTQDTAE